MLTVTFPSQELWDEATNSFVTVKGAKLQLEHSLISLSKWEMKWKVHFLNNENLSPEQSNDYIRCMTITPNVDPDVYKYIPEAVQRVVKDYIDDPMTATKIYTRQSKKFSKEIITSEVIYEWMIELGMTDISKFEKWHLNRLMTLIRVRQEKLAERNGTAKKMSKNEIFSENARLNALRKAKYHTKG